MALWKSYRSPIVDIFPTPPGLAGEGTDFFTHLNEIYKDDAYNSLSIEGYDVDDQLIEKVKNNHWNPEGVEEDRQTRNALAARGYFEAFEEVKKSIGKIFAGTNSGNVIENDLSLWHQCPFAPAVRAGLLKAHDLIGYRRSSVFIRGSRHIPLPREALLDSMETFFTCLKDEPHPAVRAILGHFIFVYIHPYTDGNGRLGRFIMNAMLASGGYPWTIVHLSNRKIYLSSLEDASVFKNIRPFAQFIASEMGKIRSG